MGLFVYCVFKTSDAPDPAMPRGVDGRPVSVLRANGLSAAVSEAPPSPEGARPTVERALAHGRVVEAVHRTRAVLPMRYGCVLAGEAAVRDLLDRHPRVYTGALAQFDGCAEMGIRVLDRGSASPGSVPRPSAGTSGKAYLLRRRMVYGEADGVLHALEKAAEACEHGLRGLFIRQKKETPSASSPMLSLFYLVRRENLTAFQDGFRGVCGQVCAKLLLSGPWPPYNFVPAECAGAGGEAAATQGLYRTILNV